MRSILWFAAAACLRCAWAQTPCPPIQFQIGYGASLTPTQSSSEVLLRQADGSYTGVEISAGSPYQILSTTPNYQKVLMACPAAANFTQPTQAPQQAIAQAKSGGYVLVTSSYQRVWPPSLDVVAFDSGFHFIGENLYPVIANLFQSGGSASVGTPVLVDLNGDGILDMVVPVAVAGVGANLISGFAVFLGTGGANFASSTFYQTSLGGDYSWYSAAIAVTDLNGDGKPDVALGSYNGQGPGKISIFPGKGDGTFQAPQPPFSLPGAVSLPISIAAADFDGDGIADLAYSYVIGGTVYTAVALGKGNWTYSAPAPYLAGGILTVGDVNGDGNLDIVADGTTILYGDGKGNFPQRRDMTGAASGNAILTDFNGDGLTDIVIGTGSAAVLAGPFVVVYPGEKNGAFVASPETYVPGLPAGETAAMTAGDLNGDRVPDVALAFQTTSALNELLILNGNGDGTFTTGFTSPLANTPSQVVMADFNRDGKPDVAVLEQGAVQVFLGQGNGTFGAPIPTAIPTGAANLAVGDFTGDGKPDLAFLTGTAGGSPQNSLQILPGNGDGTFGAPIVSALNTAPASLAVADFNGDGKLDAAVANPGAPDNTPGMLAVLFGNGDGTFGTMASLPMSPGPGIGPFSVTAADLNRDGKPDLVVLAAASGATSGGAAVLLGNGDGTFQPMVVYPAPVTFEASTVAVTDLNGDKIPDLILPGGYLLGQGDGTFQPFAAAPIGPQAPADFNGDGKVDFASIAGFGVAVTPNLSPVASGPPLVVYSAASLSPGPLAPESLATAFGSNLASPAAAGNSASPGILAGTTVSVTDFAGTARTAPQLFLSPHQINFQVPAGTASGAATVSISGEGIPTVSTLVTIAPVAPTFFQLNAWGLAGGYALAVTSGGQAAEPVFTTQNGFIVPAPIDVTGAAQLYLVLYGTGIRGGSGTCVVNSGIPYGSVTWAGQSQYAGVDQVNILVPAPVPSGVLPIAINCDGFVTNTVYVTIE